MVPADALVDPSLPVGNEVVADVGPADWCTVKRVHWERATEHSSVGGRAPHDSRGMMETCGPGTTTTPGSSEPGPWVSAPCWCG